MPFVKENVRVGDILRTDRYRYRINSINQITPDYLIAGYTDLNNSRTYSSGHFDQTFIHEPLSKKSKEELVLSKIKYLYERNPLDKSRTVPPKGIYRGSNPVSEASPPSQTGTSGDEVSVQSVRSPDFWEQFAVHMEQIRRADAERLNRSNDSQYFTASRYIRNRLYGS